MDVAVEGDHSRLVSGSLLAHGYALAASSFSRGGWSIAAAIRDQMALLNLFTHRYGQPRHTIAWGQSSGALISAGLAQQFPTRFAGALPECGVFDAAAIWNAALDTAFVFKTLLASHAPLKLVHVTDPGANLSVAQRVLAQALRSPQGRARLALAAALMDEPDWSDTPRLHPGLSALSARVTSLISELRSDSLPITFAARVELERSAGGNPSWNTGVNYATELERSVDRNDVRAMYRQARLSLAGDLSVLAHAPRIAADPRAAAYLQRNITLTGRLRVPVLTLHTTGDGIAPVEQEQDYADRVSAAGNAKLLRQVFVRRTGHGTFTAPEEITAVEVLLQRIATGRWGPLKPSALNARARTLERDALLHGGKEAPAFVTYHPPAFARPLRNQ